MRAGMVFSGFSLRSFKATLHELSYLTIQGGVRVLRRCGVLMDEGVQVVKVVHLKPSLTRFLLVRAAWVHVIAMILASFTSR